MTESAQDGSVERIMTLAGPVLIDIVAKLIDQSPEAARNFSRAFPAGDGAGARSLAAALAQQHQQIAALMRETGEQLGAAATDVTTLDWVTGEQRAKLDQAGRPGDWHQWLPEELDHRVPSWPVLTPDVLTGTLDGFIGLLAFTPEVTDVAETVMQPALQELYDQIPELAASLGMEPEELREYVAGLPDEFFSKLAEAELDDLKLDA